VEEVLFFLRPTTDTGAEVQLHSPLGEEEDYIEAEDNIFGIDPGKAQNVD
jgi:hypothetical protein